MLTRQDKLRGKRLAREKEGEGKGRGGTFDSRGGEEGGLSSTVSAVARRRKKLITLNSFQSFKFVCVDLRRQCDQMWQFSSIWVFWGDPLTIFLSYLMLGTFCAQVLLSGGNFLWRPYLVLGAFMLTIGLFFTPINWSHCTPANKKFVMTGPFSKRAQ